MQQNTPKEIATYQQRINLVLHHMREGRLNEAEAICREVLGSCPGEAGIHHLLGLLNHQLGKNEVALDLIRQAIALNPDEAEFHNNLGVVLLTVGQAEQAVTACSRAMALREQYPEACSNLGNALAATGRLNEAVSAYDRALQQQPGFAEAINNRGNALKQLGRLNDAIAAYEQAIILQPGYADAHSNLGIALQKVGRGEQAITCYRQVVALQPANSKALNNLGASLFDMGKFDEALECYSKAVLLQPSVAESFNNLGLVLQRLRRTEEAISHHRHALELKPDFPDALTCLGAALRQNGQLDDAISCYERALSLWPQNPDALTFLGVALQERGKLNEAIALHRQAIAIQPEHPEAHLHLAFTLLAQGNFPQGWAEYEWRRRLRNAGKPERDLPCPEWHGEELAGRRILIHAEQGFGDAIQFVRYVSWVAGRGGKVVLECFEELERLFTGMAGVDELVIAGERLPDFDLHCPMLSLPLAFGTTLVSIPAGTPYLHANPVLTAYWAQRISSRISSAGDQLNVGLIWAGRSTHFNDRNRSIPPELFNRLGGVPSVRYFSLQKAEAPAQPSAAVAGFEMTDWTGELKDFADTAALVANLDLVITVDTAVAHLAGAIGKPAWVLLPHPADFRWLLDREDSPWYPTLRLFRQTQPRDWEAPLARVAQNLRCLATE